MKRKAWKYAFVIVLAGALLLSACSTTPETVLPGGPGPELIDPERPAPDLPGPDRPGPGQPERPERPDRPGRPNPKPPEPDKPGQPGQPEQPEQPGDPGHANPGQTLSAAFVADTTSVFRNPERGLHTEFNFLDGRAPGNSGRDDISLVRSYVRLDDWRHTRLPSSLLDTLDRGFETLRRSGYKVVLRFSYNFGAEPDAPLNRVLEHIDQLAPVLARNSDVIAVLQAGFIGRWGEWHGSTNNLTTPANKRTITEALLSALPDSRMIQIRAPFHIMQLLGNDRHLSSDRAFTNDMQARIGFVNDCFLAGPSDAGTWPNGDEQRNRDYAAAMAPWTVTGGETCMIAFDSSAQLQSCSNATRELARFGWDYLNLGFYSGVLNRWRSGGCFDDIARNLGYRYELHNADITSNADGTLDVRLRMANAGYGNLYNPRPLNLVLSHDGREHAITLSADARHDLPLAGNGTQELVFRNVRLPRGITPGSWDVELALPDAAPALAGRPEYSIRLASRTRSGQDVWSASTGRNRLGLTLTVAAD